MKVVVIRPDFKYSGPAVKLAFTRYEAKEHKCITVAKSQGATYRDVVVLRTNKFTSPIYDDVSQLVVAMSRHTHTLTYYTVDPDDGFAKFIRGIKPTG